MNRMPKGRPGLFTAAAVGAAAVVLLCPQLAAAQTTATDGAAEQAGASDVPEIIVTATKRNERLQDVPVSVVVVTPTQLASTGTLTTTQLPNLTPGLSYGQSGQPKLSSFVIRGVGTYALSPALEASVGVAIDGVPMARVGGSVSDLVDVDHIEVLKGPQGMLFGKNATAGLISIVTNKPEIGETGFTGHLSYGSFNELNADATINYSPGDKGAFRLSAWRFGHDGFVRGIDGRKYNDKNGYGARLGITVRPTETLSLTVIGQYDERDENGTVLTDREFIPLSNPILVAYKNSIGIVPSPRNLVADLGLTPYLRARNFAVTGLADLEFGDGYTLSSITSFRDIYDKSSFDTFAQSSPLIHLNGLVDRSSYQQFTQELRIASPNDRPLSFVAGLFFYDFSVHDRQVTDVSGLVQPGISRYVSDATITNSLTNYAAFGEATFRVTPWFRLIGGIRQSHDKTGGSFVRRNPIPSVGVVPGSSLPLSFTPTDVKYDFTSYRVGAQADIADDVMLYATSSRGYKAPGFNLTVSLLANQLANNTNVGAEKVRSHEIGLKSQFFDRRLTINITGFHSVFSDFQTTASPPVSPPAFIILNANELKSTGVEVEISARPVQGLSLGVNGAYIDARYTDYNNAPCYAGQPTLPAGSALAPGFCVGGVQSLNGVSPPLAPKWSANANARYDMDIGSDWGGFISADYSYRSKTLYEGTNDPRERQGGYGVFNLNAGFGPSDKRWTVSVYARNLFETHFVNRVRNFSTVYSQINAYEAERRIGAQLEVQF